MATSPYSRGRQSLLALVSVLLGTMFAVLALEVVLRFLPVSETLETQPVNSQNPYMHRRPNIDATYSVGWNFAIVNRVHTNNYGFVNNQDYSADHTAPLLAIIGDSYVEALVVPYAQTIHGRLARFLGERGRVYSFGIGSWALSQYLAYAQFVRDVFRPRAMLFVVVGNDFDKSLLEYDASKGKYYFAREADASLTLKLVPFEPRRWRRWILSSALARYVWQNLSLPRILERFDRSDTEFVGNVSANADQVRVKKSTEVVERFLELLPVYSGLEADRIVLVIDGKRPHLYDPGSLARAQQSFFAVMRRTLIERARAGGYVVIDMQPRFIKRHARDGIRFEWEVDGHWNSWGHEEAAEAVIETRLFDRVFGAIVER